MNDSFMTETAQAWGISKQKVEDLYLWVEVHVEKQWQSTSFTTLLRRYRNSNMC